MKWVKPLKELNVLLLFLVLSNVTVGQDYLLESFDEVTFPPAGWSQTQITGTGLWDRQTIGGNPLCSPHSGNGMIRYNSYSLLANTSAILISPSIDLSISSNFRLQFWMYRDNGITSKLDSVDAYINTTSSITGAHHLGKVIRPTTAEPIVESNGWYKYEYDIPASYSGTINYIILKATSQRGMNMFVDDVRVYVPIAADNPPINFSTESITQTGLTVKWLDNSTNENGFRIYASTDNTFFTQVGSDIVSTTQLETGTEYSQSITNLLPGTTYYFRIAAFVDAESDFLTGSETTLIADQIATLKTGNWDDPTTWDTGTIPSSVDNVLINSGHTVTINSESFFNNLTIDGTLSFQPYTLSGVNVDVNSLGSITIEDGILANLYLLGNLTNSGNIDFYTSDLINGKISFTGINYQTLNNTGTADIGNIIVNKGDSYSYVAEIIANGTFTIKNGTSANFLTLANGTLKLSGSANISNNVFPSGGYTIASTSGIWLNNPNFTVLGQSGSVTNNGLFRLTEGTYFIGSGPDNAFSGGNGSVFTIEGGNLNLASRLATSSTVNFNMSGGIINVNSNLNSSSGVASFGLTSSFNTINFSGGVINLIKPSTAVSPLDYNVLGANVSITGGTLNVGVGSTPSPYTFRVQGIIPNLVVDNTTNAKTCLLSATATVKGDVTINDGSTLNVQTYNITLLGNTNSSGNIINNGLITNSSSTGSNRFYLTGVHGQQTVSGTGNIGNSTTPFAGIVFSNSNGFSIQSNITANSINLVNGLVSGANKITLGNGGSSAPIVKIGGDSMKAVGSFDQAPVFNPGVSYSVLYSSGLQPITTGFELPSLITGTLEISSNVDVTLGGSTWVQKLSFTSTNTGKLISSSDKFVTVNGSLETDITLSPGNTGYVKGPLARVLPPSLASGSTFFYPIGMGETNYFDLINPTTNSGGIARVKVEVVDEPTGGTAGENIQTGSLENRYWKAEIVSGAANFINTSLRVTQTNPAFTTESGLARSATLTGIYDLVSSDQPVGNTLASDVITDLGYFAVGVKEVSQTYVSSTSVQPNTGIIMKGEANNLIIGIEIEALGNEPALMLNIIDFSTNGTSNVADIANAKLYYTGTNSEFDLTTQVGETIVNPGASFSINPAQSLLEGTNYFWLVYDIAEDAIDKNVVDAECLSLTLNESDYTPTVTAPAGSRSIRSFLNGIYLVGTGGDYITITEAIADLNLVGISGPVVFALTDDLYSTSETFPITINHIINSSSDNYVVIKPATGKSPEIVENSTDPLFIVNASYFGIDGSNTVDGTTRDLTITNSGTAVNSGIILANSATNLSFSNINAVGGLSSAGYGITLDGISDAEIKNNNVSKALVGIQVKGSSNQILIEQNEIGAIETANRIHTKGIAIESTTNFIIRNNSIVGVLSGSSSTASGIHISGTSSIGTIYQNEIRNIKNTQLPGYGSNGIWLNSSNTSAQISVYNNLISDIASYGLGGWGVGDNGYGLVISSGGGYGIYFNTIHLNTDQTNAGSRTAGLNISSAITTANSLDIRNNIIVNTQTIGTRYAVYSGAASTVYANINHNNYHAPTAIGFITFVRTTLTDWQTGTQKDQNSLNVLPYFTSVTDLNLIASMNCALDGFGTPISGIEKDFSGIDRDVTNPDMGALEFTSIPLSEPIALSEVTCIDGIIPSLEATTTGEAIWYSDITLTTPVHSGNIFDTGQTEIGEYFYYVTDNYGSCISSPTSVSLEIVDVFTPIISTLDNIDFCQGETIEVELNIDIPGDNRQWFLNGIEIADAINETYTATEAGTCTVEVTNNGCTGNSNEIIVTVNPIPDPVISTTDGIVYCENDLINVEFTIDITGDSYQWLLNGAAIADATSSTLIATEAGIYSVEVTTNGCTGVSNEIEIIEKPLPVPTISTIDDTNLCEGQTVSVEFTIDIAGDSYQWLLDGVIIDGAIQETFTATQAGTYSVEVTTTGCSGVSNEIEVVINPVPEPTIATTNDITFCEGETVSVELTIDIAGDSYQWLLDGVKIDGANQETFTATQAGTYSVEVTTSGCSGVSNEIEVVVNPVPAPTIATTNGITFCEGETVSVEFTIDIAGDSYQWLLDGVNIDGAIQETFTATQAGTYSVEVTSNGCSGMSNEIEVVVNPVPAPTIATTNDITLCEGETVSVEFTIDIAGDSYQWLLDGVIIDGAIQETFIATQAGTYSVEVTTTGCSGVSNEIEVVINPVPAPTIATTNDITFCEGETVSVEFTIDIAGDSYQWLLDGVIIDGAIQETFTATQAGTYSVEVTSSGCSGVSNEIEVVVNAVPSPTISTNDPIDWFEGEAISVSFTVDIDNADGYQWYLNDQPIENATLDTYEATDGGTYFVEVSVGECTGISNSIVVTVSPIPTHTVTFTVTNTSTAAVANAEIVIESLEAIYTDVDGIATINLPDGTYNYVVNADNFEVFTSSFNVDGEALDIPVELIGVGIDQNKILSVKAFPNPFSNEIRISNPELVDRVVISNIAGQKMVEIKLDGQDNINTQALPEGVYIMRIHGHNGKIAIYKMIKE